MRGENIALRNLSLTIGAGEHVAILGPNGCGKSTLIKTITRECYPLSQPGAGIAILGHSRWNVFNLRSMLGIVSNDLMAQCTREVTGFEIVLSGFFSSIGIWPNHHVLPAMEAASGTRPNPAAEATLPRGNGETILVIDDEASILVITGQTLEAFGYKALPASAGPEAVTIYAQHRDEIAVVVTDVSMPVMNGPAIVRALMSINPAVKIIAASGLHGNRGVHFYAA